MSQKRVFGILVRDWIGTGIVLIMLLMMGLVLFSSEDMMRPKIPKPVTAPASK